jgi:hypothetical protein
MSAGWQAIQKYRKRRNGSPNSLKNGVSALNINPEALEGSNARYDAFLSYSHKDAELVKPLVQMISLNGRRVFWDVHGIAPGDQWANTIVEAIGSTTLLVVLWCCDTAKSEWVNREIDEARKHNVRIVPVLLCDFPLNDSIREFQWIDLRNTLQHKCRHTRRVSNTKGWIFGLAFTGLIVLAASLLLRPQVGTRGSDGEEIPLSWLIAGAIAVVVLLWRVTRHAARSTGTRASGSIRSVELGIEKSRDRETLHMIIDGLTNRL